MKDQFNNQTVLRQSRSTAEIDQGLRAYMIKVYNYMTLGLGITGTVAYLASTSPELMATLFATPLKWVILFAPIGIVFFLSARISSMTASAAQLTFWIYSALMGLSLSAIFAIFVGESVARMFFITASVFGTMSLYGYTTKKDLSEFGSFLIMGLIGIVIASLVNLFMQSNGMQMIISSICVLVFTGLTAYDTQRIKEMYYNDDSLETSSKKAILGALNLYLDFVNIFISLLQLFGDRR